MITRDSDLVDGIPGGQEVSLPSSKANAEAVANVSEEVTIKFDVHFVLSLCCEKVSTKATYNSEIFVIFRLSHLMMEQQILSLL